MARSLLTDSDLKVIALTVNRVKPNEIAGCRTTLEKVLSFGRSLELGRTAQKNLSPHTRQARTSLILVRLWNAQNTGVMDSNNRWRFHARVDITFAATRSVDSLSDGGSSARERW